MTADDYRSSHEQTLNLSYHRVIMNKMRSPEW